MTPPTSTDRQSLTRDRILDAAIELADAEGVDGLSMRKLAKHLGYEVMSLYNHVKNKDDLLDGMVDRVASEIQEPDDGLDWKASVRQVAVSANKAMIRHRWAAAIWGTRWPGPARWRTMEVLLEQLARADFTDDLADLGFHAITLHINGFTQQQISYSSFSEAEEEEMFARVAQEVTPANYPRMFDHIAYHQRNTAQHDEFGFVLDLILDGLERAQTS